MKFLAAAIVLFIGVTGDLAIQSASSASAATPATGTAAISGLHHGLGHPTRRPDPFVFSHRVVRPASAASTTLH